MANNDKVQHKVCLIVIDGWGLSKEEYGNAIHHAATPVMDELCSRNSMELEAHGEHVGLPEGLMGNSEVGHLNIGSGRPVYQDIVRINMSIRQNTLVKNEILVAAAERAKAGNGRFHLAGLVSDGGVHSHIEHLFALVKALKELGVPQLYIHFYGDGRDTSPTSGSGYLQQLLDFLDSQAYGKVATVVGRYYAMDRDKRWERICVAYEAMVAGKGEESTADKVLNVVKARYEAGETDEFLKPIILEGADGRVKDDDTLFFFDYRADRMREISEVMGLERYKDCNSSAQHPKNLLVGGMTQYKAEFGFPALFPPINNDNVLAEWLAKQGCTQFHCAETEKYAHVTFFFNGGKEAQYEGEERKMVPSPKVATYDLLPEMSSESVGAEMVEVLRSGRHPFVMCNFAPPDMVGHTGVYDAAVKACEATDVAIGRMRDAAEAAGYILMVTADHGNAEKMIAPDGGKHTAHTCNTVPFTCSSKDYRFVQPEARRAALCDVAPTVLYLMGLPVPPEMSGQPILQKA